MKYSREDLWERAKRFALRVIKLYGALPRETTAQVIGKQLLRSGTSVGANFRETHRARSDNKFVAKIGICLQELEETSYWLELLRDTQIVRPRSSPTYSMKPTSLLPYLRPLAVR